MNDMLLFERGTKLLNENEARRRLRKQQAVEDSGWLMYKSVEPLLTLFPDKFTSDYAFNPVDSRVWIKRGTLLWRALQMFGMEPFIDPTFEGEESNDR